MPSASSRHTASVNKRRSPPPEPTLRRHQLPTMKSDFLASKVKRKDGESSLKVKSDETMINGHPHSAELLREKGGKVEMRSVTDEERKDGEAVSRKRKADVMEFDGEVMTTLKNGLAMMARGLAEISLAFGRLESSHPSPVMPHSQDPIFRPPTVDRKASIIKKASSRPTIVDLTLAQPRKRPKLDDPNRPKKPKNAYMLFCDDVRERSRKEGLKITQAELTTEAGMMWKEMGKKEKDIYLKKAETLSNKFKQAIADYESSTQPPKPSPEHIRAVLQQSKAEAEQAEEEVPLIVKRRQSSSTKRKRDEENDDGGRTPLMTYARRRSIRREEAETDEDEDELVVVENGKFRRRKEENEKKVQGEEDERQSDAKKEDEFGFVKNIKARRGNLQETDDEEEEALAARKGKARRGSQYKGDAQPVKNGITVATGQTSEGDEGESDDEENGVVDFKKENERDEKKAEEDEEDDDDEDEDENEEATPSKNPKSRRKDRDMAEEGSEEEKGRIDKENDDIVASKHVHTRQGNDDDDESEDGDEGSDEEVTEDDDDENKVSVKAANPHSKKILENEDDREDANDEDTDADNSILADLPKDVVSPHLNKLQLPSNSSHLTPSAASGKSRQTRTPKETFSFTQASRPTKPNLSSGPTQQRTSYVSKQPVVETNQRTSHTPHSAKPNVEHVSEHTSNTSKPGKVDVEAAYPGQPGIPGALKSGNALTGIGATELRRKSELVKVDGASQRMLISRRLSGPVGDGDKERRLSEDRYPRGPMLGKGKGWPSSKKRRAGF